MEIIYISVNVKNKMKMKMKIPKTNKLRFGTLLKI
jgi:hypothetical protein